jgi:glutamine amidotransferase
LSSGKSVGVVHFGAGNTGSVVRALTRLGADATILSRPEQIAHVSRVIVPGVGSFAKAMVALRDQGWVQMLHAHVDSGRPLAGICLGMQLLMQSGAEGGNEEGLGLIAGEVRPLRPAHGEKVPHIGWNGVVVEYSHTLLDGVRPGADFYFAHSWVVSPCEVGTIVGTTVYGESFPSIVAKDNVVGFQFHPEKSPPMGPTLLRNFLKWSP